jgi:hypothetical protein
LEADPSHREQRSVSIFIQGPLIDPVGLVDSRRSAYNAQRHEVLQSSGFRCDPLPGFEHGIKLCTTSLIDVHVKVFD